MHPLRCAVAVLALTACNSKEEGPAEYKYEIRLAQDVPWSDAVQLEVQGATLPIAKDRPTPFTVGREPLLSEPSARFVFKLESTCGPLEIRAMVGKAGLSDERFARDLARNSGNVLIDVHPETVPPHTMLYVDNLDADAPRTLHVGKLALTIPARTAFRSAITTGSCAESQEITLDGEKIGALAPAREGRATLVDLAGGHCYATAEVRYGGTVPAAPIPPALLPVQRVLDAPVVAYFLTPPPKTITIVGEARLSSELQRVACSGSAAGTASGSPAAATVTPIGAPPATPTAATPQPAAPTPAGPKPPARAQPAAPSRPPAPSRPGPPRPPTDSPF